MSLQKNKGESFPCIPWFGIDFFLVLISLEFNCTNLPGKFGGIKFGTCTAKFEIPRYISPFLF